ncbi:MAG TPA: Lrp/AsnC family transcriptional regulator [Myxococcota bacterium]|nr:Lrp/AsnC family transcriptional regulator [Myxococcota bacterium]
MDLPELDRTDRGILRLLQNDSRQSFKQVAASVGLAASTVYERVRRLERAGVLRGARFEVDPRALGVNLEAMVFVQLSAHDVDVFSQFAAHIDQLPMVVRWYNLAGSQDFAVVVAAADSDHLRVLILEHLTSRPEVRHIETNLIFERRTSGVLPDYLG